MLMDLSDVLHSSFLEGDFNNNARTADPQNAARHIFASITARLNKDDKVFLRQESNGGFYYDRSKALRLSFAGALLKMEDA